VASRIKSGSDILAADYIDQFAIRRQTMRLVQQQTRIFDALIMPTSPLIPPKIEALSTIDAKLKMSGMALRNTALANFLDRPTITIPCHKPGAAPVGLSLMGSHKHDRRLLAIAAGAEATIRG
jgi:aspartyl-tRNA(Asn)/glutamyl-tRNA(Gln) amidotransferase subunit A